MSARPTPADVRLSEILQDPSLRSAFVTDLSRVNPQAAQIIAAHEQRLQSYGQRLINLNDDERMELARQVNPTFTQRLDAGHSLVEWVRDQLASAGYAQEAASFYSRRNPWGQRPAARQVYPSRRYLLFEEAGPLLQSGEIVRFIIDPENQREVTGGNIRMTLIGGDGNEYDVVVRYDATTNQIYPPR